MSPKDDKNPPSTGLVTRIWRSMVRSPLVPKSDDDRKKIVISNLVFHFRPLRLPRKTLRYSHTFGLGGMSATLFALLVASGLLLMFVYEPSPERAHDSITRLQDDMLFGKLVRNFHHWSANALILVVFLHLLRVYLTGGYHGSRQFNWLIGLGLLLAVLGSNFTGYLLPWDQLSYWAITICTAMLGYVPGLGPWLQGVVRGGSEIGAATLINFYTLHTTLLPVGLVLLMAFHFWRVRKAGGVVVPRAAGEEHATETDYALTLPELLLRELAVALVLVAALTLCSVFFNAPLGAEANPGMSPNPAKAPWYFLGFQELLLHFHPLFAVVILPLVALVLLVLIPYVNYTDDSSGVLLVSPKGRRMALIAAVAALTLTPLWILLDELWLDPSVWLPGLPSVISEGLLPVGLLLALVVVFLAGLGRRFAASSNETLQAGFVLLTVAFLVMTATGIWFRGAGMGLVWPGGP